MLRMMMAKKAIARRIATPRLGLAAAHAAAGHRLQRQSRLVQARSLVTGKRAQALNRRAQVRHSIAAFHAMASVVFQQTSILVLSNTIALFAMYVHY